MTSRENNDQTEEFFVKNNYFDYPKEAVKFFIQGELPMVNTEGKILLNEEGIILGLTVNPNNLITNKDINYNNIKALIKK